MTLSKKILLIVCLIALCSTQSGCQLLTLPFQLVGGVFNLLGKALQVADSMPKPPPWVFL